MPDKPTSMDRRALMLGFGCCATAAAAAIVTPRRHEALIGTARLDNIIPTQVGDWRAVPNGALVLPDAPQADRFYDQVLTRTFVNGSASPIMLLIAYAAAQSGLMRVHRPDVCYSSAGFDIRDAHPVDLPSGLPLPIAGQSFIADRDDRIEQVLYWTRISDAFPRDLMAQRLTMLKRGLAGISPDGVLVRVSTLVQTGADQIEQLERFSAALIASAGPIGRTLLIGNRIAKSS